jgi:hypothetical protein
MFRIISEQVYVAIMLNLCSWGMQLDLGMALGYTAVLLYFFFSTGGWSYSIVTGKDPYADDFLTSFAAV